MKKQYIFIFVFLSIIVFTSYKYYNYKTYIIGENLKEFSIELSMFFTSYISNAIKAEKYENITEKDFLVKLFENYSFSKEEESFYKNQLFLQSDPQSCKFVLGFKGEDNMIGGITYAVEPNIKEITAIKDISFCEYLKNGSNYDIILMQAKCIKTEELNSFKPLTQPPGHLSYK